MATADRQGNAHLVPLSFYWSGAVLTMATVEASPAARNLRASGRARLAIGGTRDVLLIHGDVTAYALDTAPPGLADEFAARLWDVRLERQPFGFFLVRPRIQAWREVNEPSGRDLMRDGEWLVTRPAGRHKAKLTASNRWARPAYHGWYEAQPR